MAYASGQHANAICDICGWTCKYTELRDYIYNQIPTGDRVCPECYDLDNPQLQVGKMNLGPEAEALMKPRPDTGKQSSTSFFGWMPVIGLTMQFTLNPVTVTTT